MTTPTSHITSDPHPTNEEVEQLLALLRGAVYLFDTKRGPQGGGCRRAAKAVRREYNHQHIRRALRFLDEEISDRSVLPELSRSPSWGIDDLRSLQSKCAMMRMYI